MITRISKIISLFLLKKEVIEKNKLEIYIYGFETILSILITILIAVGLGIILNVFLYSILYVLIFSTTRQFTGGYHADTYLKCNITFSIVSFLVLVTIKLSCLVEQNLLYFVIILLFVIDLVIIIIFSPVENKNKPLSDNQKIKNKRIILIEVIPLFLMSIIILKFSIIFSLTVSLTLFSIAMLIVIEKILERRKNSYEKKQHIKSNC